MKLHLIAVGTRMPAWTTSGFMDYAARFPPELKLEITEIPAGARSKSRDPKTAIAEEGRRQLAALPKRVYVVALDERGEAWSTAQLAQKLKSWLQNGRDIALLVGGPDGLAAECLERADARWSLSPLTLPHALVRVLVAEQLYRALSILKNHPYHRA